MTAPLRVAMVHYHLRRGGVTRVIENAIGALGDHDVSCVAIAGGAPPSGILSDARIQVVDGLGYEGDGPALEPDILLRNIRRAADEALGGPPDVWHIHNHALGKNVRWPEMVRLMAEQGERLLLQIHDFAEDGRPENYRDLRIFHDDEKDLGGILYPQADHVHYALLNSRDRRSLLDSGFPSARTHLLPNAAWMGTADEAHPASAAEGERFFLYATRAIRRKNVGEFLFWAAVAEKGDRFAVTLAPENPKEQTFYERWVECARRERLPVEFEAGAHADFPALISSAYALVSTSVAEGFGLAFLEPWLAGKPLAGRNLPEITREFEEEGVDLSDLYEHLRVPLGWIDETLWRKKIGRGLKAYLEAYGREPEEQHVERALQSAVQEDRVDFGRLDEELQEAVIHRVRESETARNEIRPPALMPEPVDMKRVSRNREIIRDQFGLPQYGRRLMTMYGRVMGSGTEPGNPVSADTVLDQFLSPERFFLLRS